MAHPGFRPVGAFRVHPEDFEVSENLTFAPEGEGNHFLLRVRKIGINTDLVARDLARLAGCRPRDVGFAGLKDRHALAVQHFTLPADRLSVDPRNWSGKGWAVESADRARKKLKRGALAGNRFRLLLRVPPRARWTVAAKFERAMRRGVPNYFGPQRFGRGGANLDGARHLFAGGKAGDRHRRGLYLSAARSYLFNRVLAARVKAGTWDRLLPGEVALFHGKASGFVIADPEIEHNRWERGILHPSGPLPGRDGLIPEGGVRDLEEAILADDGNLVEGSITAGVDAHRRATRLTVDEGGWRLEPSGVRVTFSLTAGAFATAVVREVIRAD
ncbi:tRNA pseudouridine(13) synthase TruD [Thiohalorhabdus sp.]|uniref:tRNA pseudouridine(13) synthase TruD n=1 Tax=Thiohalorhabdus sp. TaxID=3094134 RepID=UPI002FC29385